MDSVTLTGSGGLFTRLGKLMKWFADVKTGFESASTVPYEFAELFNSDTSAIQELDWLRTIAGDALALDEKIRASATELRAEIVTIAQQLVIDQVNADTNQPDRELVTALRSVVRQMVAAGKYVGATTFTTSTTKTNLTGNGTVVVSTKDGRGLAAAWMFKETLGIECTASGDPGDEQLQVVGTAAAASRNDVNWMILGSGASKSYSAVIGDSAANLVSNGSLDAFTGDAADDWTFGSGTASTHYTAEATDVYRAGGKALKVKGDGSNLLEWKQDITADLDSLTNYAVNMFARVSATAAAGSLRVGLWDGSAWVQDANGADQYFDVDITALTTSYAAKNGVLRTPLVLPATVYLRFKLQTAITNTKNLLVDDIAIVPMESPTGDERTPSLAFFSGSTAWTTDDGKPDTNKIFRVATSESSANDLRDMFEQFFGAVELGVKLPLSGSSEITPGSVIV